MKEKCPGTGDYALDVWKWRDAVYLCEGCGRLLRIPKRGHMVGLVPFHKRDRPDSP